MVGKHHLHHCTKSYAWLLPKTEQENGNEDWRRVFIGADQTSSFRKMAEECGLAKALVKKRIIEQIDRIIPALDEIETDHQASEGVKALIKDHCLKTLRLIKG